MKREIVLKRVLSLFAAVVLFFASISFTPVAAKSDSVNDNIIQIKTDANTVLIAPKQMYSSNADANVQTQADAKLQALKEYIRAELVKCTRIINISAFSFEASSENQALLVEWIWNQMPEAFHIDYISLSSRNGIIFSLEPSYSYTASEYAVMHDACVKAADKLLEGIKDNSSLSDVEMALIIHDRIAVWCEYDYENFYNGTVPEESYTMYGVLENQIAVCQGYAETYMYLLSLVGIESAVCSSRALNHAWNIVTINDKKYHVDVTFDDPVGDVTGRVHHTNFLLSSDALYNNDHRANDYDTTPSDTTYDNYFWQNSETAFQLVDGELYYIDNENEMLTRYSDKKGLYSVSDVWMTTSGGWWVGNYSKLSSDGNILFFNTSQEIYSFDPKTNVAEKVFEPDLSAGESFSIYGFKFENNYLVCDLYNRPNYDAPTKYLYQERIYYDSVDPSAAIYADSEGPSPVQKLTVELTDDSSIDGFYWGTDTDYTKNSYNKTSETSVFVSVTESGTYYLVVKDSFGNLSDTYYVTFNKITLDANGGSIASEYLITHCGNTFTLPVAEKQGFVCTGWALEAEASEPLYGRNEDFTVTENILLYATWAKAQLADANADGKVNMADVVAIRRYLVNDALYPLLAENVADITGDGKINMADAVALRRYLVNAELYPIG